MDRQPVLEGERLYLRPLTESDWPALFAVASDRELWSNHPSHDRWLEPVFRAFFDDALAKGGALAIGRADPPCHRRPVQPRWGDPDRVRLQRVQLVSLATACLVDGDPQKRRLSDRPPCLVIGTGCDSGDAGPSAGASPRQAEEARASAEHAARPCSVAPEWAWAVWTCVGQTAPRSVGCYWARSCFGVSGFRLC